MRKSPFLGPHQIRVSSRGLHTPRAARTQHAPSSFSTSQPCRYTVRPQHVRWVRARLPAFGRHQCRKLSIGCARLVPPRALQARLVDRRHHESMWPRGRNWQARFTRAVTSARTHTHTPPPQAVTGQGAGNAISRRPIGAARSHHSEPPLPVAVDPPSAVARFPARRSRRPHPVALP